MKKKYSNPILAFLERNGVASALIGLGLVALAIILFDQQSDAAAMAAKWSLFIGIAMLGNAAYVLNLWIDERRIIAAFKQQTSDIFVYSLGTDETKEDDNTVLKRVDFALTYLALANNKHCITIWYAFFRDAYVFAIDLDENGAEKGRRRVLREGLTVRETRAEFKAWFEQFRAEKEQAKLVEARSSYDADKWVDQHWFKQI